MYWLIVKTSILSLLAISVLHYLYIYFKSTLTTPKVKDHVYIPASQYLELYKSMENNTTSNETNDMKDELKEYLQQLSNKSGISSQPPSRPSSPLSVVSLRSGNTTPWEQPLDQDHLDTPDTIPTFMNL